MFELSENPMVLANGLVLTYIKDVDGSNFVFKIMNSRVPFDEDKYGKTVFEISREDPCFMLLRNLEKQLGVSIIRNPSDPKWKPTISIKKCMKLNKLSISQNIFSWRLLFY